MGDVLQQVNLVLAVVGASATVWLFVTQFFGKSRNQNNERWLTEMLEHPRNSPEQVKVLQMLRIEAEAEVVSRIAFPSSQVLLAVLVVIGLTAMAALAGFELSRDDWAFQIFAVLLADLGAVVAVNRAVYMRTARRDACRGYVAGQAFERGDVGAVLWWRQAPKPWRLWTWVFVVSLSVMSFSMGFAVNPGMGSSTVALGLLLSSYSGLGAVAYRWLSTRGLVHRLTRPTQRHVKGRQTTDGPRSRG